MATKVKIKRPNSSAPFGTTQRAYTMFLRAQDANNRTWRQDLWETHRRVNEATQFFGDWLLTVRGGIPIPKKNLTPEQKRILALCWFVVESDENQPENIRVKHNDVGGSEGGRKADKQEIEKAFKECLKAKGIKEDWWPDCKDALFAEIKSKVRGEKGSVWIQRWKMYEDMQIKPDVNEIADILYENYKFLGKDYLKPVNDREEDNTEAVAQNTENNETTGEKHKSKKRKETHDPSNQAGQFCCDYFGEGKGTDFDKLRKRCLEVKEFAEKMKGTENSPKVLRDKIINFRNEKGWAEIKLSKKPKPADETELNRGKPLKEEWEKLLTTLKINVEKPVVNESEIQTFLSREFWESLSALADKTYKNKEDKKGKPKQKPNWASTLLSELKKCVDSDYGGDASGKSNLWFFLMIAGFGARRVSQTHSWVKNAEARRSKSEKTIQEKETLFSQHPEWTEGRKWLEEYLAGRIVASNALGEMRIRNNAVDGWDEIVKAWNKSADADERKEELRRLQDDLDKFGDVNLFLDLAKDEALPIWKPNGKAEPDLLKNFVKLQNAKHYVRHFKVPSFRHPDPINHPAFCEFGNSKPHIEYAWKDNPESRNLNEITKVDLYLLNKKAELRWQSERLKVDLGFRAEKSVKEGEASSTDKHEVSRADRLGLSARGYNLTDKAKADYIFSKNIKEWNARLEIYRSDLKRLKNLPVHKRDEFMRDRLRWFITFSPQLPKYGPWWKYLGENQVLSKIVINISLPPKTRYAKENRREDAPVNIVRLTDKNEAVTKCFTHVNGDYGWLVRPGLGNLPKIRVMGVDLGHRYGAVCTIWEQLDKSELERIAKEYAQNLPGQDTLYLTFEDTKAPKLLDAQKQPRKLFFRRIGENIWAKLERQFVIKLPGEETKPRKLLEWEIQWFKKFYANIGRKHKDDLWTKKDISYNRIEALNGARFALKHHGNVIKIWHALVSTKRATTGGKEAAINTPKERAEYIKSVIELWNQLASDEKWDNSVARALWSGYIATIEPKLKLKAENAQKEESLEKEAKKERNKLYENIAEKLAEDETSREKIAQNFLESWFAMEKLWPDILKNLGNMIAKGRKPSDEKNSKALEQETREKKNTGGLSLERIAALGLVAKLHNAYRQRPTDKSLRNELEPGESPCKKFCKKMERLRNDRIKKLANVIAMSAMGLVGTGKNKVEKLETARETGARFNPVHAVCVESLENYRPEATRTRRENRALMSWSAGQLQKYLGEACDLYGIFLAEVSPSYTSRFCSRCGAPGIRGEIVGLDKFKKDEWWQKQVKKAEKRKEKNDKKFSSRDQYLIDLKNGTDSEKKIPIPVQGGQIFFCSNHNCGASGGHEKENKKGEKYISIGGIQADFNASANIALRAMTDGGWHGKWVYIPVNKEGKPNIEKKKKNALTNAPKELAEAVLNVTKKATEEKKTDNGQKETTSVHNIFRDITDGVGIKGVKWLYHKDFFKVVEEKVINNFKQIVQGELAKV